MADVFLSYGSKNAAAAKRVADLLEESGWSVWYDLDLPAHRTYSEVIERELLAAKSVLVLWSNSAVKSQWVRSEANRARELGKLVQCRLDDAQLPMPFDQIQCADLRRWRGRPPAGWTQVIASIEAIAAEHRDGGAGRGTHAAATRRDILVAASGISALTIGGGWWLIRRRSADTRIPAAAVPLLQQAKIAQWQVTHEGQNQAIGLYQQVVRENPQFADGWGFLSIAYAWTAHYRSSAEAVSLRDRARSAAEQAFAIDPQNPVARAGLAMAQPILHHWSTVNAALRSAVMERPKLDDLAFHLAMFLLSTGRSVEALNYMNLVLPAGPTPAVYFYQALMLWSAGRSEALDNRLAEARRLYPTHFALWFTHFYTAIFSGRPEEALSLAADTTNWPTGVDPAEVQAVIRVAQVMHSPSPSGVEAVVREWMAKAHEAAGEAENAAQFMTALGRHDEAFAVLRAYFFSEGFDCGEVRFNKVQGTFTPRNDRLTHFLFFPSLAPLRSDPRFTKLLSDLQFTSYWKASGALPDYLRKL